MAARKRFYIYPVDISSRTNFLIGYRVALGAVSIPESHNAHRQGEDRRGWQQNAQGPVGQMRMSSEQIINELMAIEIDLLREIQSGD